MGARIVPIARNFMVSRETFTVGSPDVIDGCIDAGAHRLLRLDVLCHNAGDADLVVGSPAERPDLFQFSAADQRYYLHDFVSMELRDGSGAVVASGRKRSFCLIDVERIDGGARATPQFTECNTRQGISAGWADLYPARLPCQYVVIDGVGDGDYAIRVTIAAQRLLADAPSQGTAVEVPVRLDGDQVSAGAPVATTPAPSAWNPPAPSAWNPPAPVASPTPAPAWSAPPEPPPSWSAPPTPAWSPPPAVASPLPAPFASQPPTPAPTPSWSTAPTPSWSTPPAATPSWTAPPASTPSWSASPAPTSSAYAPSVPSWSASSASTSSPPPAWAPSPASPPAATRPHRQQAAAPTALADFARHVTDAATPAAAARYLAPGFVGHRLATSPSLADPIDGAAYATDLGTLAATFGAARTRLLVSAAEAEWQVAAWTRQHAGARPLRLAGLSVVRLAGGRIAEQWDVASADWLRALGLANALGPLE